MRYSRAGISALGCLICGKSRLDPTCVLLHVAIVWRSPFLFRKVLDSKLETGFPFSSTLHRHSDSFSPLFIVILLCPFLFLGFIHLLTPDHFTFSNFYYTFSPSFPSPVSRDSVVGIATCYGQVDREVGVRVPVGWRTLTSSCRPNLLCVLHSTSYKMCTGGSFPG
jgi:hypothetical protein